MRYFPHTQEDIEQMLATIGIKQIEKLFPTIPQDCRRTEPLDLPNPMTEWELVDKMETLSQKMTVSPEYKLFVGAGSYDHFIPASTSYLLSRSEFVTSYTPYQPEMSQGTLQAIYEYQSLVARLLGLEVTNASIYDGASSFAEAILMAVRITGQKRIAISRLVHPLYRRVAQTYLRATDYELVELPYLENGITDLTSVNAMDDLAAVAIQSPNFFGCIEDLSAVSSAAKGKNALSIVGFTEPIAYGLYKNPGNQGADIACGEGQSLGIPRSFGGPALGLFASRFKYVRNMPGRIVGETTDQQGKRGYVLTLATREQHIRREKATSNICTNNSLCALAAAMYLASAGGTGMGEIARLNYDKSEYLKANLRSAGFTLPFDSHTFNEFVVKVPSNFEKTYQRLLDKKIVAGLPLAQFDSSFADYYLFCVTETASKEDIDDLVQEMTS